MIKAKNILIIIAAVMVLCLAASCTTHSPVQAETEKSTVRENGFNIPNKDDWHDANDSTRPETVHDEPEKKEPGVIEPHEKEPSDFVIGLWTGAIWGDSIFYSCINGSSREIRYQNIRDVGTTGLPLYADVLSFDAFTMDTLPFMLIDEAATVKNGGMPVLIIAYGKGRQNDYRFRIVSFNTLTNKVTVIQENISRVMSLALYRDTLYYTTEEDEEIGRLLHKINLDGSGYSTLGDFDRVVDLSLGWVDDGVVYYSDGVTGEVFQCDADLKNSRLLFKVENVPLESIIKFVSDGYIYYRENRSPDDLYKAGFILRRPLDDIEKSEVFLENVAGDMFDGKLLYMYSETGWDVLYEYDPKTGETCIVYDVRDQGLDLAYSMYSERYLICETYGDSRNDIYYLCFDLETGEQIKIPR